MCPFPLVHSFWLLRLSTLEDTSALWLSRRHLKIEPPRQLPSACEPQEGFFDPWWSFQTSPLIALVQVHGNYSEMFEVPAPGTL